MSEEPASELRRFESGPMNQQSAQPPLHVIASIDSLPDAVLQHCFSFVGKGHYRFVSGTSCRFKEIYSTNHESKTTWKNAASSVACAELCLQDFHENGGEDDKDCLKTIATEGAVKIGNIKVLEWARRKGLGFESEDFGVATFKGDLPVLQWAQEKNLEWYNSNTLITSATGGHIHIFEWIHDSGREMLGVEIAARAAALAGHVSLLSSMKKRNVFGSSSGPDLYYFSSMLGLTRVLDWLHESGYAVCLDSIFKGAASGNKYIASLIWARQHGITLDEFTATCAAFNGNLPMLQWLRENDCPWDNGVIHAAEHGVPGDHDRVLEWAIANGCPTE